MKKSYYEIKIYIDENVFDRIIGFFSGYKNSGFLEEDDSITGYICFEDWIKEFPQNLNDFLNELKNGHEIEDFNLEIKQVQEENWNKKWEESIQPIIISSKIIIKPTWKELKTDPGKIIIQIDPKMAFGTGHHETTRLCIQAMEKYIKPGYKILDMGTGTGIIAIAAIFLGADSAVGIDNDEWAYDNAIENLKLNNVENKVKIILGSEKSIPADKYDLITSNIDFRTNSQLVGIYPRLLNKDGVIILSGLLITDLGDMKDIIHNSDLKVIEEKIENEWGSLILMKN